MAAARGRAPSSRPGRTTPSLWLSDGHGTPPPTSSTSSPRTRSTPQTSRSPAPTSSPRPFMTVPQWAARTPADPSQHQGTPTTIISPAATSSSAVWNNRRHGQRLLRLLGRRPLLSPPAPDRGPTTLGHPPGRPGPAPYPTPPGPHLTQRQLPSLAMAANGTSRQGFRAATVAELVRAQWGDHRAGRSTGIACSPTTSWRGSRGAGRAAVELLPHGARGAPRGAARQRARVRSGWAPPRWPARPSSASTRHAGGPSWRATSPTPTVSSW